MLFHRNIVGPRHDDRAVPVLRPRPVPRHRGRPALLDPGRLHVDRPLPVLDAHRGRRQLHPQLGQGGHRRLPRHDDVLPGGRDGPDRRDARQDLPGPVHAAGARCPSRCGAHIRYPEDIFAHPERDVRDVPHDQPGGLLQQGGPVGGAGRSSAAGAAAPMEPYYTIMRLPGETRRRVHPDAAVHAAAQGQPRGLDGGAQRRRALRPAAGVPVPEAEGRLRPAADRRAHQPGPGHLAADHAVEPAGVGGDPGHAAGHPDRGVAALRPAALPARGRRARSPSSSASSSPTRTRS